MMNVQIAWEAQEERLRENEVQSNAAIALKYEREETRIAIQAHHEKVKDVLKQMFSLRKEGSTLLKSTQNDAIKSAVNALLTDWTNAPTLHIPLVQHGLHSMK